MIIKRDELDMALDRVRPVIKEVRTFGDKALFKYTKLYDNVDLTKKTIRVSKEECFAAIKKVKKETLKAINEAASNIRKFCEAQMPKEFQYELKKGIELRQIIRPIRRVGCYVPAGRYPLPSTVLMTVIPAKVAGVKEIIICTPPRLNNNELLAAAAIAGADMVFRVGGSQAIAAMAYGTESIPKVDKIVGPGNIYVTAAKKLVYGDVGIDLLAGPSEIVIYSNKGNPEYIAADMLSQAEHDRLAKSIFITTKKELASKVEKEMQKQLKTLATKDVAAAAKKSVIIAKNEAEAISFINEFAPEHLEIDDEEVLKKIQNAGSIFIGSYSCEAAGDYASGTNHVLPTAGSARFRSGLSVYDFIKLPTVQKLTREGLKYLSKPIIALAKAEGLEAHAKAVEKRLK